MNQALRAFDKVVSNGAKVDDKYTHQGITAWSDLDGYTVTLSDDDVSLSIYFHNKYEFDYKNAHQLEAFLNKLKSIDKQNN